MYRDPDEPTSELFRVMLPRRRKPGEPGDLTEALDWPRASFPQDGQRVIRDNGTLLTVTGGQPVGGRTGRMPTRRIGGRLAHAAAAGLCGRRVRGKRHDAVAAADDRPS